MGENLFANPEGTREQILAATYRTLRQRGYTELTISAIGEEFDKSPSLVYRHYDSKDDLVLSCLESMLDQYEQRFTEADVTDPKARLSAFLERGFPETVADDRRQFITTLVELRSLAAHDDAYRAHFTRSDEVFTTSLADIVRAGIDQGVFADCDPDRVAFYLFSTLAGAMQRRVTTEDEAWIGDVRAEVEQYLETRVYR